MRVSKNLRILLLLLILVQLVYAFRLPANPAPDWDRTLNIVILPYNADGLPTTQAYIDQLRADDFQAIERFLSAQARRYKPSPIQPFAIQLLDPIQRSPALPPRNGYLASLRWALGLRWWHWRLDAAKGATDIVVVARYQSTGETGLDLHSIGMPSPRLALVNISADPNQQASNQLILTHELLHTVGANDHYTFPTGFPAWPDGYAEPDRDPRYPQSAAELMAGRIPLSPRTARQARSLEEALIGPATARDIGWSAP